MRLHLFTLLAATVIPIYIPSSSATPCPEMVLVDRPTTDCSLAGACRTVSDNRLLQAENATEREERAPFSSKASALTEAMALDRLTLLWEKDDAVSGDTFDAKVSARMKELRDLIGAVDAKAIQEHPERREMGLKFSKGSDGPRDVLQLSPIPEREQAIEAPKVISAGSVRDPVIEEITDIFKHPASLRVVKKYVTDRNAAHSKSYTLLDALVEIYGGVAKLAPALSKAKLDPKSKDEATRLQKELLMIWKGEGKTVNDVFYILQLSELLTRGLKYENLDTFERYIELYNKNLRGNKIRLETQLVHNFGDSAITRMIKIAGHESTYGKMMMKNRFRYWRYIKNRFAPIVEKLYNAKFSDCVIVDLLSEFYRGMANLLQALLEAKLYYSKNSQVERFQTSLVKTWLDSHKSIDDVFDLLELSKTTDGGITEAKMTIFEEYVQLSNEGQMDKIDAKQYRMQRLAEAARVDQKPAAKRQRIEGPAVRR